MAELSYPFETQDTTESQYSRLFSELQDNGVAGDTFDNAGIAASVTTGMNLQVSAGFAIIRGFAYENTSPVTLTADASTAQPRIDTVILRLDPGANSIVAAIKKGTPAGSPSAPALTQVPGAVWELPLADILIPANATALDGANLTDRRAFLGSRVGLWRTSARPANPDHATFGFNVTTGKFEWYDSNANVWSSAIPMDLTVADGSITDAKLVVPPRRYLGIDVNNNTTLTLTSASAGRLIRATNNGGLTVTINANSLDEGDRVDFFQGGVGPITFAPAVGVSLISKSNNRKTNGEWTAASLTRVNNGQYLLVGDLVA